MDTLINIGIYAIYILAFVAIAAILYFAVRALVSNFKDASVTLIGIGVLVVVFVLSFVISSSSDVSIFFFEKTETNPAYSKLIGSGLITLYFFLAGVFATIIYAQVSKLLKR